MKAPGRVRVKLAAKLQENFPTYGGLEITWSADQLYPAQGAWRTNTNIDCWAWNGFAKHYREDGSSFPVLSVGGYTTMSALLRAEKLTLDVYTGEVTGI